MGMAGEVAARKRKATAAVAKAKRRAVSNVTAFCSRGRSTGQRDLFPHGSGGIEVTDLSAGCTNERQGCGRRIGTVSRLYRMRFGSDATRFRIGSVHKRL